MRVQHIRWLAAGAVLCLFLSTSGQTPALKGAQAAAQSSQWITHKDPQLYSVESPPGWTASPDRKGWVRLKGTQGEEVVIWPVFIRGAVDPRFAPFIHASLAASNPYQAQWEDQQAVAANALRARGKSGNAVVISVFTWVSSPQGLAGMFYLVAAREPDFRQKQNDFARILGSFRIMGAPVEAGALPSGGIQYVQFADPKEGAFTIDVPAGWRTQGGLFRFLVADVRVGTESVSPDGQMRILIGDARSGMFSAPMPYFPEGSVYNPPGLNVLVRRFTHGAVICQEYVASKFLQLCPNLKITDRKDLSAQVPKLLADYAGAGSSWGTLIYMASKTDTTWGDVSFRCGDQAQPKIGRCQAITTLVGGPIWEVHTVSAFLAPAEKESLASSIWEHMRWSIHYKPEWVAMEDRMLGQAGQIVSQGASAIADEWWAHQKQRNAIDDAIAHRRSNATLGVADVADPQTGRRLTVESGSNYYWVDPRGVIVGTNTDTLPSVDFHALLQLP